MFGEISVYYDTGATSQHAQSAPSRAYKHNRSPTQTASHNSSPPSCSSRLLRHLPLPKVSQSRCFNLLRPNPSRRRCANGWIDAGWKLSLNRFECVPISRPRGGTVCRILCSLHCVDSESLRNMYLNLNLEQTYPSPFAHTLIYTASFFHRYSAKLKS